MVANKFKQMLQDEGAVSPVIGVILMVAITVILAAVIGTFVLGLGDNVQETPQAGVTFDEVVGQEVDVQLDSVQSADYIWVVADSVDDADPNTGEADDASNWDSTANSDSASSSTAGDGELDNADTSPNGPEHADQYLLGLDSNDNQLGGPGDIVTMEYGPDGADVDSGTVSVIGEVQGETAVLQTYEHADAN